MPNILPDFNLPFTYQKQTISMLIAVIIISIMITARFIIPWKQSRSSYKSELFEMIN